MASIVRQREEQVDGITNVVRSFPRCWQCDTVQVQYREPDLACCGPVIIYRLFLFASSGKPVIKSITGVVNMM